MLLAEFSEFGTRHATCSYLDANARHHFRIYSHGSTHSLLEAFHFDIATLNCHTMLHGRGLINFSRFFNAFRSNHCTSSPVARICIWCRTERKIQKQILLDFSGCDGRNIQRKIDFSFFGCHVLLIEWKTSTKNMRVCVCV